MILSHYLNKIGWTEGENQKENQTALPFYL